MDDVVELDTKITLEATEFAFEDIAFPLDEVTELAFEDRELFTDKLDALFNVLEDTDVSVSPPLPPQAVSVKQSTRLPKDLAVLKRVMMRILILQK